MRIAVNAEITVTTKKGFVFLSGTLTSSDPSHVVNQHETKRLIGEVGTMH